MITLLILAVIIAMALIPNSANAQTQQSGYVFKANSGTTFGWFAPSWINRADSTNMVAPYLKKVDTASLSDRVNTKLATAAFTGAAIIAAMGFTPYNSTNPSGYITTADISGKANSASPVFTGTITQSSATIATQKYYLTPITTTNATPVLLASIPIATNKSFDIEIYMMAVKSDGLTRNCGYIRGVFSRVSGNLAQDGTLKNNLLGVMSTTKCTFVLNNTTHVVEVYANGLAATTINWNFFLEITNLL